MRKPQVLMIGFLISIILGCGGSNKPSEEVIESEFQHVWYAIHGEFGEKERWGGWHLQQIEIGDVTVGDVATSANANITFTYLKDGSRVTKSGVFVFRLFDGNWEIDDREGKDLSSSTTYKLTP